MAANNTVASPFVEVGDMSLRHDITILADYGVITAPITAWPMSWDSIATDVRDAESRNAMPVSVKRALFRVKKRLQHETEKRQLRLSARVSAESRDEAMPVFRSFDTPNREETEVSAGFDWLGENTAIKLNTTYVDDPVDGKNYRADGSYVGLLAAGWSYGVSTLDRWWGPGYEGSLILSNNARPVPAVSIQRMSAEPFETKWLSWLGPWQMKFFAGQLESERTVPHAKLLGLRINFKPFDSLEIGLSRTAQWGGEGRPENLDSFVDMVLGHDNVNENGITPENEPGNQLAGWDLRWKPGKTLPLTLYMQRIGEDQAGIWPTSNMYQFGAETWGSFENHDYRLVVEYSDTSAYRSTSHDWNAAYNHGSIYLDGYRYYGQSIGHTIDSDSTMASARFSLFGAQGVNWQFVVTNGKINRDNEGLNAVSLAALNFRSAQIRRRQPFWQGELDLGLNYIEIEDKQSAVSESDTQAMLQWRRFF